MKRIIAACLFCAAALTGAFAQDGGFRIGDRSVEIGFMNLGVAFANDYISAGEFFQKTVVIDLDKLAGNGLGMNLGIGLTPLSFSYARNDAENPWGFGLAIDVDATGAVEISGDMLGFKTVDDARSNIGGAAFAALRISSFFHVPTTPEVGTFKVRVSPSLFFPILYVDPKISYTNNADTFSLDYNVKVFTPIAMGNNASGDLNWAPGLDLSLGVEHPLAETLGLTDISPLLNFRVGMDFVNIPIVAGRLMEYMEVSGRVSDILGGGGFGDIMNSDGDGDGNTYGTGEISVRRPFKLHAWAEWSPFETVPVSFTPILGLAVNPIYLSPTSMEGGVRSRYDFRNLFIGSLDLGYFDRMWKAGLDVALNLRFFELNLGFTTALSGKGFGANLGFKFGW